MAKLIKKLVDKEEYDQKIDRLKTMGIDPNKLKNHNRGFFNAIVTKMQTTGSFSHPSDPYQLWWPEGNKEYAKKLSKEDRYDNEEQMDSDVRTELMKLKKPSGKKAIRGKRKK